MQELINLQNYWWLLIAVLGGVLVVLLFVQGGQTMLFGASDKQHRNKMISMLGRKWELTFTSLVVFGGAFFASFPLFYSTSFGGAYWLWMLILFSFVLQAVSYEFRSKPGNLFGTSTYDAFLFINGCVACILLGVAVSMFFFGGHFTVTMGNILNGSSPVISQWDSSHGFEAIFDWRNLLLGFAVLFLTRCNAALYFMHNDSGDHAFFEANRRRVLVNGAIFLVFFLAFAAVLLTYPGYQLTSTGATQFTLHNTFERVSGKYFYNYLQLWWALCCFLLGVVMVLYALVRGAFGKHFRGGIWFSGIGTFLVVISLFFVAGYADTPYLPSLDDPSCSLTIRNSSSTLFTLKVMSYVSIIVPFVIAYIAYAWYSLESKKKKAAK